MHACTSNSTNIIQQSPQANGDGIDGSGDIGIDIHIDAAVHGFWIGKKTKQLLETDCS